jgi:hypothetical protein
MFYSKREVHSVNMLNLLARRPLVLIHIQELIMPRKHLNKNALASVILLLLVFVFRAFTTEAAERLPKNIQWKATAILLDGIDTREKYSIPVKEAINFISSHSRFKIQFSGEVFDLPHTYTFYDCDAGPQQCVIVNKWDLDTSIWESVRTRDFYMLLWDTAGHPPLQAGGTWGVADPS